MLFRDYQLAGNTFYAIYDDWKSDLEMYILRNKILTETYMIGRMQNSDEYRFRNELNSIKQVFKDAFAKLKGPETNLRKAFLETKYFISKNLNKSILPSFTEKISSKNLSGLISKLENDIEMSLEVLSDSRVVVKSENYIRPLKSYELESISISDLTSFEMLPKLRGNFSNIKNSLLPSLLKSMNISLILIILLYLHWKLLLQILRILIQAKKTANK
jgi:hypothetical protein